MNPQGNTMQPPAPLARKAERVLMTIAAAYNVIMASITLFMFTSWFKGQAYDLLEHNGLLKTDYSAVDNASTVVGIYALLVLIIGIVSFIMSMRCLAPGTTSRWVIIWLAIVVVFSPGHDGPHRPCTVFHHPGHLSGPQQGHRGAAGCDPHMGPHASGLILLPEESCRSRGGGFLRIRAC